MDNKRYIQVILPLKLGWEPFYVLPDAEVQPRVGDRALVPFAGKSYLAVVSAVDSVPPSEIKGIREIYGLQPRKDRILPSEIAFWRVIADYYLCTLGEIYKAAYPSVKDESVRVRKKQEAPAAMLESVPGIPGIAEKASADVEAALKKGRPLLLNVPHSTDVLLQQCLKHADGNVLWLAGETKMTKALESRAREVLGSRLLVWGSKITPARKREVARAVRSGQPYVILGTRSALFLPHHNLSLVVVQEEHELSYKQTSPAPRYNGRDAAILLASVLEEDGQRRPDVILESSSPSFESLLNVSSGKYESVVYPREYALQTDIVDTRAELRKNGMVGELSRRLVSAFAAAGKAAVFKPRRAAFPKMEDLLPQIDAAFGPGKVFVTDDLVENPISEGTDCLAVLGVDAMLGRNDFRADERLLQSISQAMGQCGSALRTLVIQTKDASHPVFSGVNALLKERADFGYPPYTRLVDICIHDTFPDRAARMSQALLKAVNALGICPVMPLGQGGLRVVLQRDRNLNVRKKTLLSLVEDFEKQNKYAGHIYFDVDPQ